MFENKTDTKTEGAVSELGKELDKMDRALDEGQPTGPKVAPAPVIVPPKVVSLVVRTENALILSALTKDCSAAIKEAAREAIKPTDSDLAAAGQFLSALIEKYAPTAFADPFTTAAAVYAGNLAIKVATVKAVVDGGK